MAIHSLYSMAERNISIRECKRCGGYFAPKAKKVFYCDNCKKPYSRQALYAAIKWERMTEEERSKARSKNTQIKATSRLVQKLHKEGNSIREISNKTGRTEDRVRKTLKNKS